MDRDIEETPKIKSPSLIIPARVPVGKYNGKLQQYRQGVASDNFRGGSGGLIKRKF